MSFYKYLWGNFSRYLHPALLMGCHSRRLGMAAHQLTEKDCKVASAKKIWAYTHPSPYSKPEQKNARKLNVSHHCIQEINSRNTQSKSSSISWVSCRPYPIGLSEWRMMSDKLVFASLLCSQSLSAVHYTLQCMHRSSVVQSLQCVEQFAV